MSKIDYQNNVTTIENKFKLIMALYIDEIHTFARHLRRNNSMHGPSLNDHKNLVKSVLVFLLTTLTVKKYLLVYAVNLFAMINQNTHVKSYCLV